VTGITFNNSGNTQTLFSSTDNIVGRATTDTMTNKTLLGAASGNAVTLLNSQDTLTNVTGNGTDQTLYTFTVPANTLQAGKCLSLWTLERSNNAVAVTYKVIIGATTVGSIPNGSAVETDQFQIKVCNNSGTQNAQTNMFLGIGGTAIISNASTTSAENFANAITIKITANEANPNTVTPVKWVMDLDQ
jgi:hypothetical protein